MSRYVPKIVPALLGCLLTCSNGSALEQREINFAIERGVVALRKMQSLDGTWRYNQIGATALAALTLLECDVPPDDPGIQKATKVIRAAVPKLTHTYSLSLSILFFDRLGLKRDRPLIESMTVRLLAGQTTTGGWSYQCPPVSDAEVRRLTEIVQQDVEVKEDDKVPKFDPKGERRRARDLPEAIQQQIAIVNRMAPQQMGFGNQMGDNSNTQFATLALWVARRHGLPVQRALARIDFRYRRTQNRDGGWSYQPSMHGEGNVGGPRPFAHTSSTGAMTCAGMLGLAVNHGALQEADGPKAPDPKKDLALRAGIVALSTIVGQPITEPGRAPNQWRQFVRGVANNAGGSYYLLWSLERVAVAMNLKTIGKKDWYTWGAELLLASQRLDGSWNGSYGAYGADTCFALLFLKRSNLASDLTSRFNTFSDPFMVTLRPGGVGGDPLKRVPKGIKSALDPKAGIHKGKGSDDKDKKLVAIPTEIEDKEVRQLSQALVRADGAERDRIIKQLQESKGGDNTEALAFAIPLLEGRAKTQAREALANRLTRMTTGTLKTYLSNGDSEIRRAAVIATAMRDKRALIPQAIELLDDPDQSVVISARFALKAMTKKDFGPEPNATPEERAKALKAWKTWWKSNGS